VRKRRAKPKWFLRQYTCKSDRCQVFFAGVDKIFFKAASLRQCKSDVQNRRVALRHYTRNGVACQVFFARMVQIVCNCTSLRSGDENCTKLVQMCEKFLTFRPRARPPGIALRFLHEWRENHLTTHGIADIMYA